MKEGSASSISAVFFVATITSVTCSAAEAVRVSATLRPGCPALDQPCPVAKQGAMAGEYWRLSLPVGTGGAISVNNLPLWKRLLNAAYSKNNVISGVMNAQIAAQPNMIKALPLFTFARTNGGPWQAADNNGIVAVVTSPFVAENTGLITARFKVLINNDVTSDGFKLLTNGAKVVAQFTSVPKGVLSFLGDQNTVNTAVQLEDSIAKLFSDKADGDQVISFYPEAISAISFSFSDDGKQSVELFRLEPKSMYSVFAEMPGSVPRQVAALKYSYEVPGNTVTVKVPDALSTSLKDRLKTGEDYTQPLDPALCVQLERDLIDLGLSAKDRAIIAAGFLDAVFWTESLARRDAQDICFKQFEGRWAALPELSKIPSRDQLRQKEQDRSVADIGSGRLQNSIANAFKPDVARATRLKVFEPQVQIGASADPSIAPLLPRVADPDDLSVQSTIVIAGDLLDNVLGSDIVYVKPAGFGSCIRPINSQSGHILRISCLQFQGRRLAADIAFADDPFGNENARIKSVVFQKLF